MAGRLLFAAALFSVHSFTPALAADMSTITAAPKPKRTPSHHDLAELVNRQATAVSGSPLPLTQYDFPYSQVPYQVNPFPVGRGPQAGYNKCNSTTEGPTSECQTLIANNISDFCLWGSPTANGQIGDVEAAVVAYCAQTGHGTRIMPPGTLTGVQFMKTSAYIQITGHLNQTGIGLLSNDTGGELDPHGADLAGNPLGGLVYSSGLPTAKDNTTLAQVTSWNNFVGSGAFCIKLCDPTVTTPNYCENRIDLLGCDYNMPASYTDGQFTSCGVNSRMSLVFIPLMDRPSRGRNPPHSHQIQLCPGHREFPPPPTVLLILQNNCSVPTPPLPLDQQQPPLVPPLLARVVQVPEQQPVVPPRTAQDDWSSALDYLHCSARLLCCCKKEPWLW